MIERKRRMIKVYLTIGNGWAPPKIDHKPYYGLTGYREALALFEQAIDKHEGVARLEISNDVT